MQKLTNTWQQTKNRLEKRLENPEALTWLQGLAKLLVLLRILQDLPFILPQASIVVSRGQSSETL